MGRIQDVIDVVTVIRELAAQGRLRLTRHARNEMDADEIVTNDLLRGVAALDCDLIEDYPHDARGPSHLVLIWSEAEEPIHVCCAVQEDELVIITVYRPDSELWQDNWRVRA